MHAIHERRLRACAILSVLLAACASPRMGLEPSTEPERARPADARLESGARPTPEPDAGADGQTPDDPDDPDAARVADVGPTPDPLAPTPGIPTPDGGTLPPGACTPGDRQCGPASFPETCSATGVWVPEAQACPFVCQGRGMCGGECQPGARKCGDPPGALTPYLCDQDGRWRPEAPCQNLCSSGSCAGSCVPGTSRCDGIRRQMCSAMGTWETIETCPFVCSGGGQCTGECKPSTRSCSDTTPRTCDAAGRWVSGNTCQSPANGSVRCEGGTCAVTCPNGMCGSGCCQCDSHADCPGRACVAGACAGECSPGARGCSGNTPQTCNASGRWAAGSACQAPTYGSARCQDGTCAVTCANGTCGSGCCQCNDNGDCPGRACVAGACAGECSPGARGCSGNTPQTCNSTGRWASGSTCQAPMYGSVRCQDGSCSTSCANGMCGSGCCECNANSDCTSGDRRACVSGRCVESQITSVSYDVQGADNGQTICMNANPPSGCPRQPASTGACNGKRSCDLKIAWKDPFGGGGDLGDDPCEFIVKNVYNLRYTCSHDGSSRPANPRQFITPNDAGCTARVLDTVTLSCP